MCRGLSLAALPPAKLRLLWGSSVSKACADGASPALVQELGRGRLQQLRHLSLRRSRVDERALRALATISSLEELDFGESTLVAQEAGLADLIAALPRLGALSLSACGLRAGDALDPLLLSIHAAPALRDLDLSENDVDDAAVSRLGNFLSRAFRLRLTHTFAPARTRHSAAPPAPAVTAPLSSQLPVT